MPSFIRSPFKIFALILALAATLPAHAQRKPTVSYTVSGSSDAWILDFTVVNHFAAGEGNLYFFGVRLETGRSIVGSPANWAPDSISSFNTSIYGGANIEYNNVWITSPSGASFISPGASLSGFSVVVPTLSPPTGVSFFAFAAGGTYNGDDYFSGHDNPGFNGTANRATQNVHGAVTLDDLGPDEAGRQATIEILQGGTVLESHTATLGVAGAYSFSTSLSGTYDVACKSSHWLRRLRTGIVIGSVVDFDLINGDCDGDNEVTLADYAQLSSAFGSADGDPSWNANADLDGDGEVTLSDYSILSRNFGLAGD